MDWIAYHQAAIAIEEEVVGLDPEALVRIDLLEDGWGCSILWADLECEEYGEGTDPLAAMTEALELVRKRYGRSADLGN